MAILEGRRGLVVGIANARSLAHGIARALRREGARLVLTYQTERLRPAVHAIGEALGAEAVLPCDLTEPDHVRQITATLRDRWGALDFAVHAAAHALRSDLEGRFIDTSLEGFRTALEVSAYSLVTLLKHVENLLAQGQGSPSIVTLTHYGSEKSFPNYNVMGVAKAALEAAVRYLAADLGPTGIRVNAISAGAIKTLSAAGIKGLRRMLHQSAHIAPLRRNVTIDDVGDAALYLLSDLARGVTGEVLHVDAGYHSVGALAPTSPEGGTP